MTQISIFLNGQNLSVEAPARRALTTAIRLSRHTREQDKLPTVYGDLACRQGMTNDQLLFHSNNEFNFFTIILFNGRTANKSGDCRRPETDELSSGDG